MKKFIPIIAVIIIVGAGAFYAGMKYDQSKNTGANLSASALANMTPEQRQTLFQQRQQAGGTNNQRGAIRANGNFAAGEIIAKDDKTITIKLQDGGSKIVFLSDTTPITKSAEGTSADLTIGQQVTASGTANSDGSLTAQNIQIRPAQASAPALNGQPQ